MAGLVLVKAYAVGVCLLVGGCLAVCLSMLTGPSYVKNLACEDWGEVYLSSPSSVEDTSLPTLIVQLRFACFLSY